MPDSNRNDRSLDSDQRCDARGTLPDRQPVCINCYARSQPSICHLGGLLYCSPSRLSARRRCLAIAAAVACTDASLHRAVLSFSPILASCVGEMADFPGSCKAGR